MDDVVAAPVEQQVPEHAEPEDERRQDPPPAAAAHVQRHPRSDDAHVDAGHAGIGAAIPLAQRHVRHLVAVGREPLGEVAVPALGAADRVGEEAVVDEADAHARRRVSRTPSARVRDPMGYLRRVFEATEEENRRAILDTVVPRPGARLLDLGCADGVVTLRIAERVGAGELHGVELVPELAERARAAGIAVTEADLGERLPFDDASFDVIHSNQVIEHLRGTDHFMREIRRVLRPDGYAIVSTNNLASWHNVGALVLGHQPTPCHVSDERIVGNPLNFVDGAPGAVGQMHLRIFTGRALAELAALHGLNAEVQRTAGYYPFPSWLARRLTRLDPLHGAFLVQRYRPVRSASSSAPATASGTPSTISTSSSQ